MFPVARSAGVWGGRVGERRREGGRRGGEGRGGSERRREEREGEKRQAKLVY